MNIQTVNLASPVTSAALTTTNKLYCCLVVRP